jgi:hypothetical protein
MEFLIQPAIEEGEYLYDHLFSQIKTGVGDQFSYSG